jgi:hypothetical protein
LKTGDRSLCTCRSTDSSLSPGENPVVAAASNHVIRFVRRKAFVTIRGDHDTALALDVDCQCSPPNKPLADATLAYHRTVVGGENIDWLYTDPLEK